MYVCLTNFPPLAMNETISETFSFHHHAYDVSTCTTYYIFASVTETMKQSPFNDVASFEPFARWRTGHDTNNGADASLV